MTAGNTIAMEGIFSWMKGVAVFLIFSGFLLQLLPDEKYQKYVRFVIGLVLMLLVGAPLFRLGNLEENIVDRIHLFFDGTEPGGVPYRFAMRKKGIGNSWKRNIRISLRSSWRSLQRKKDMKSFPCRQRYP